MNAVLKQTVKSAATFFKWWREGLLHAMPLRILNFGYQADKYLLHPPIENHPPKRKLIEKSFLGRRRIAHAPAHIETRIASFCLPDNEYYQLKILLPKSSLEHLASAVALRLEEVSPIKLSKAFYCYKKIGRDNNRNIIVDVILARKKTIYAALENLSDNHLITSVVANPNNDPNDLFTLYKTQQKKEKIINSFSLTFIIIIISCFIFGAGFMNFAKRENAVHARYEQELISSLKTGKKATDRLGADLEKLTPGQNGKSYVRFSSALTQNLSSLPTTFAITSINYEYDSLEVTGLAPESEQEKLQQKFTNINFNKSDYPGYNLIQITILIDERLS